MSGLSEEDRARLEVLGQYVDCEVVLRALALIDQQEKALEAGDELARVLSEQTVQHESTDDQVRYIRRIRLARDAYRSARGER